MKYGQFYYSYGVYGTEGSPNMYLASSSSSATTMFLRKLVRIFADSVTQSLMTANLISIWDTTPLNPATWQDAALNPAVWTTQTASGAHWQDASLNSAVWTDQTESDADWQDTRT